MFLINLCFGVCVIFVPAILFGGWILQHFLTTPLDRHGIHFIHFFLPVLMMVLTCGVIYMLSERSFARNSQFPILSTLDGSSTIVCTHPVWSVLALIGITYLIFCWWTTKIAQLGRFVLSMIAALCWLISIVWFLFDDPNNIVAIFEQYRYLGILNIFTCFTFMLLVFIPTKFRHPILILCISLPIITWGTLFMQGYMNS